MVRERGVASSSRRARREGGGGDVATLMPDWIGSMPMRRPPIPASFAAMRRLRACSSSASASASSGSPDSSGDDLLSLGTPPSVLSSSAGAAKTDGWAREIGGGAPSLIPPSLAMRSAIVFLRFNPPSPSASLTDWGDTADVGGTDSEPVGGGARGGELDREWNRGSIGSAIISAK